MGKSLRVWRREVNVLCRPLHPGSRRVKTPWQPRRAGAYALPVKNSPLSASPQDIRRLKKCVRELRALLREASDILRDLMLDPAAEIARGLCARFHILQEYFVLRYQEARARAIVALGYGNAVLSFP